MASTDRLVRWLNDAYAMEHQLIPTLENHANDVRSSHPSSAQRIRQHIDEGRRHAERLDACLRQLAATPSTPNSTLASLMGAARAHLDRGVPG